MLVCAFLEWDLMANKAVLELIAPHLYLSNEFAAATIDLLITSNIRLLVNTGYPQSHSHFDQDDDFSYVSVPLIDAEDEDILQYFPPVFETIGMLIPPHSSHNSRQCYDPGIQCVNLLSWWDFLSLWFLCSWLHDVEIPVLLPFHFC